MIRCILESPYAAPKTLRDEWAKARAEQGEHSRTALWVGEKIKAAEARHLRYLRALALHAFDRGFAPYASHALYTQWLDDHDPVQRTLGIKAGFAWAEGVEHVLVGVDLGVSAGMELGLKLHREAGRKVEEVRLGADWGRRSVESGAFQGAEAFRVGERRRA